MGAKELTTPKVTIIGCGTPNPMPESFGSAYVVDIGGEKLLFDCGPATTWKLVRNGIALTDINTVVFTHHHFDHDADFPAFILTRWDRSVPREVPLEVFGPTLTEKFTNGILDEDTGLFSHDWKARVEHPASQAAFAARGGELPRNKPTVLAKDIGPGPVKETDRYRITAAPAEHVEPWLDSLAYRIDTDDGSLVITGDTRACDSVANLAKGADVMMVMCWESHDQMSDYDLRTACSIQTASEMAAETGVKQLTLVHIGPRLLEPEHTAASEREARKKFGGELVWGREGMIMPWPVR